jgi:hypothetical protein
VQDFFGEHAGFGFGIRPGADPGLDHSEFVAAEPSDDLRGAQDGGEALGDFGEQDIAIVVPERITDRFEAIEVQEV